jgi:uncharacterized protein involved in cysteine biosynthesis
MAGLWAFPRGFLLLVSERGVKRLMLPPFAITVLFFCGLIYAAERGLSAWLDSSLSAGEEGRMALDSLDPGWWRSALEWLLNEGFGLELLRGGSWVLFVALAVLFAWFTFSLVFELVAGPFLDELHGILEERWFGFDPRKLRHRPTELEARLCASLSWRLGLAGALLAVAAFWQLSGPLALLAFPAFLVPFALALLPGGLPGLPHGAEYAKWLRWVLVDNTRALSASASVALLTLALLVFAFPLNFVPVVGSLLFAGIVGMGTAIGMLDLPLERRDLTVSQRLSFATGHLGAVTLFGVVTGAVFAVPVIGPMVAIPSASLGALWLVCRLDKGFLAR